MSFLGLGKIPKGVRFYRAWGRFDEATKRIWAMKNKSWKRTTGSLLLALSVFAPALLRMLNVPEEMIIEIVKVLAGLGILIGGAGVVHAKMKAKK